MAVDKYRKPCFDSSVFVGGLKREICNTIKRGVVFEWIWSRAKTGDFRVYISAITLAEVYHLRKAQQTSRPLLDEFLDLINEEFVDVIEVDRETGLLAHKLCRQYSREKLYPNDAIHLACALRAGCDVLLAWDHRLLNVNHPDIRIEEPSIYDRHLFTESEIATKEEIEDYDGKTAADQK